MSVETENFANARKGPALPAAARVKNVSVGTVAKGFGPGRVRDRDVSYPLRSNSRINQPASRGVRFLEPRDACRHQSFSQEEKHGIHKRRYSERWLPGSAVFQFRKKHWFPRQEREKIVLPTRFLLGGNITDPLNLNSLTDEGINRMLNARTPVSSPLPVPMHKLEPTIHMPVNIKDPLNLSAGENFVPLTTSWEQKARNVRNNKRRKKRLESDNACQASVAAESQLRETSLAMKPLCIEVDTARDAEFLRPGCVPMDSGADAKLKRIANRIVSPVIPQTSPKRKRRRTMSEGWQGEESTTKAVAREDVGDGEGATRSEKVIKPDQPAAEKTAKSERPTPVRHRNKRNSNQQQQPAPMNFRAKNKKFVHGNYNAYYGYRNADFEDGRLRRFTRQQFAGKDVLDVGCNVGHVTLTVARDLNPRLIVGVDVDRSLVAAAKKNIRHYMSAVTPSADWFPVAMRMCYGPLSAPLPSSEGFPNNVMFQVVSNIGCGRLNLHYLNLLY